MEKLINLVLQWAKDKGILEYENRFVQLSTSLEEVGEFKDAVSEDDQKLELGDIYVTLIILAGQLSVDFQKVWAMSTGLYRNIPEKVTNPNLEDLFYRYTRLAQALNKESSHIFDVLMLSVVQKVNWLAEQHDFDPKECLQLAYNKIKNRKGKKIDGRFVKEEDL